jgi:hypothetical protein
MGLNNMGSKSLERQIAEAASDFKLGLSNSGFATYAGGRGSLKKTLFDLVEKWEVEPEDSGKRAALRKLSVEKMH